MSDLQDPSTLPPSALGQRLLERVRSEEPVEEYLIALAGSTHEELTAVRTDRQTALAFWINLYNAATQLLLDRRPELYDSRIKFFRARAVTVGGVDLSLDDIEHGILRGGRSKYGLGYLPRLERTGLGSAYQLDRDYRIHFALNCGAVSCPAIRSYDPETIDQVLDDATGTYLDRVVEYDSSRDRVLLPRLCLWFIGDFGGRSGLRRLVADHELVPPGSSPSLRFAEYDWEKSPRMFAQ